VHKIIAAIRTNAFLRNNLIFFVGSVGVGALNYLYYPVLGRLLTPAAFGEVQTLVSLFLQLTAFLTVLGLVVVNVVANYADKTKRHAIILELEKVALIGALAVLALTVAFGEQLRAFLQFDSEWPFIVLAVAVVATVPFTSRTAYLRGMQRFVVTSVANALGAAGKIILSVLLVILGFGTAGAIGGLTLAQFGALAFAGWQSRRSGFAAPQSFKKFAPPKLGTIVPELRYAMFVLFGSLGIMVLFSVDVIVVKRFFDAHTAGLYAGVAAVARVIFFLTASIAQVLLPAVSITQAVKYNRRLGLRSALLLFGVTAPVLVVFVLAPEFIVVSLMGASYAPYAGLLPLMGGAMFGISLLNLAVLYFLALRRYVPAVLTVIGAVATCAALCVWHDTLGMVVAILCAATVVIMGAVAMWLLWMLARHRDMPLI
jgi:O-antigen/teichoic acid export membrane protein